MPQITKQYKFCAAHKYWNDSWSEEKNKQVFADDVRIHGHNYDLYITIKGPINQESGFIINLLDLNKLVILFQKNYQELHIDKGLQWY